MKLPPITPIQPIMATEWKHKCRRVFHQRQFPLWLNKPREWCVTLDTKLLSNLYRHANCDQKDIWLGKCKFIFYSFSISKYDLFAVFSCQTNLSQPDGLFTYLVFHTRGTLPVQSWWMEYSVQTLQSSQTVVSNMKWYKYSILSILSILVSSFIPLFPDKKNKSIN